MTRKRIGWGAGVWLIYGAFVVFILGCVAFASMQRFDLVASDYYARQIDYQTQIDKSNRTALLPAQPRIEYQSGDRSLSLAFPGIVAPDQTTGMVRLFRPSNSSWDRSVPLALDSLGTQVIPGNKLISGFWKVKVDWQSNGESFYYEQSIVIK